jgi:hypothetical protein
MMKKMACLICIASVMFSSVMMSSADVVNTVTDGSSCVSSIYLIKNQLPVFVRALPFVTDPADKAILTHIIKTLQIVGTVEQSDLEKITRDLGVNRSFFSGVVSARGDFGHAYFFPRLLRSFLSSHMGPGGYMLGPAFCSYWEVFDYPEFSRTAWCEVNGDIVVQGNNSGIIIGGIGGYERDSGEGEGYPYFEYRAIAILIIIRSPV